MAADKIASYFDAAYITGTGRKEAQTSWRPFTGVVELATMEILVSEFSDNGDIIAITLDQILEAVHQANSK